MEEGRYLQECGAGEEESPRMSTQDELLKTSDQNPEEEQNVANSDSEDSIAEIMDTQDALKTMNSRMNLRQENAVLVSENTALYCHIESLRKTVNELEDAHVASQETKMTNIISELNEENEYLKVRCENITSEMYSVLSEGKKKTKIILDHLIDVHLAQQQQLKEEHQLALDKKGQDLHEKSMMIEELLTTVQELKTNNQHLEVQLEKAMMFGGSHVDQPIAKAEDLGQLPHTLVEVSDVEEVEEIKQEQSLDVQTKSWWRRQRDKVVKGMATFRLRFRCSVGVRTSKRSVFNRCNKVQPVNFDV